MASLTIRKLPDDVKADLRLVAAKNGRSLEEEARQALIAVVRPPSKQPRESIGQMIYRLSRPGFDLPELPDTPVDTGVFDEE
jgi:hypothetical protein